MSNRGIIFLNQTIGPLFRELLEDLSLQCSDNLLFATLESNSEWHPKKGLKVIPAPSYDRSNIYARIYSWIEYFLLAIIFINRNKNYETILIVSNPPFLGLAGLIFKLISNKKYFIIVYDIYPDLLIGTKRLKNRLLITIWKKLNEIIYKNAEHVITISQDMAKRLEKLININHSTSHHVSVIPPWADSKKIYPIEKKKNWFAKKYSLEEKTVVLYSGNMGLSHDIESILYAAKKLSNEEKIHFMLIGGGARYKIVKNFIKDNKLNNTSLIPFLPEDVLPYSMSAGDIGIIPYEEGTEGCILPSKACYYMAAGLATIVISVQETDLSKLIRRKACGIWLNKKDQLADAILYLHNNERKLENFKLESRKLAQTYFDRTNTLKFIKLISNTTKKVELYGK